MLEYSFTTIIPTAFVAVTVLIFLYLVASEMFHS